MSFGRRLIEPSLTLGPIGPNQN